GFKISPKFDLIIKNLRTLPISNVIDMYAEEKARLRQNGTPIYDDFDLLIACTSVVNGMIMVTENLKDFKNIKGISIENWIVRD
nr:type II toxin-antitoxin system VapC family toxin [Paludibacteraceae bacterium]